MRPSLFFLGFLVLTGAGRAGAESIRFDVFYDGGHVLPLFNQFNPALGTLTGVEATFSGTGVAGITFLADLPNTTIDATLHGTVAYHFGATAVDQQAVPFSHAFGQSTRFNYTWNLPSSASSSITDPTALATFVGTGKLPFGVTFIPVAFPVTGGTADIHPSSIIGRGTAQITYEYSPSAVPEPAPLVMLATGLAGVLAVARRRLPSSAP